MTPSISGPELSPMLTRTSARPAVRRSALKPASASSIASAPTTAWSVEPGKSAMIPSPRYWLMNPPCAWITGSMYP